jgi:hypothetical protein
MIHEGPTFIPLILSDAEASFNSLLSPSTTRRKGRGERGQPCLIPPSALEKGKANPFIRIAKEAMLIQLRVQVTKERLNPRWISRNLRYNQRTLSKTLERFTFKVRAL